MIKEKDQVVVFKARGENCFVTEHNNKIIEGFVKSKDKVITLLNFRNIKENL